MHMVELSVRRGDDMKRGVVRICGFNELRDDLRDLEGHQVRRG